MSAGLAVLAIFGLLTLAFIQITGPSGMLIVLLTSLALFPKTLAIFGEPQVHFGISSSVPTLTLHAVALVGLGFSLRRLTTPTWLQSVTVMFSTYLLVGLLWLWDGNAPQISGAVHLAITMMAFLIGFKAAQSGLFSGKNYRLILNVLLLLSGIQASVCLIQLASVPVFFYDYVQIYLDEGRAVGTLYHPSAPGKISLFITLLALPATVGHSRRMNVIAWVIVMTNIAICGMTLSRANTVGLIVAVTIWLVISHGTSISLGRKLSLTVAFSAVAVPAANVALARFSTDASGGNRERLAEAGMPFIREYALKGMGPNYYVELVGQFDAITASGYPIHNTFLLSIAELGIAGAILLMLPLAWTLTLAIRHVGSSNSSSSWARAVLAITPGLLLISWTGWGMLAETIPVIWFLTFGIAAGSIIQRNQDHSYENIPVTPMANRGVTR